MQDGATFQVIGRHKMSLPRDLKSVKKRIRAYRIVERIVKIAFITFSVLCFLFLFGFIASY